MAILDATPGSATANSYATVEEADVYHEGHLYSSTWFALTEDQKVSALIMGARGLDGYPLAWTGLATDDLQAMGWPRVGMLSRNGFPISIDEIPQDLKDAQSEYARQLAEANRTADNSVVNKGITSLKAGSVSLSFASPTGSAKQITSLLAMLPDAVRMLLVPSWLKSTAAVIEEAETASDSLVFEVL